MTRAEILALAGGAEHPHRRMRVVNDLCRWRDPESEASIGERACKLDVVEEDRIALVEDVVVGKERPPQEKTARRWLRYRSRLREILVEHPVLAKLPRASGQELAHERASVRQRHREGRKPEMERLRRAVRVHVQRVRPQPRPDDPRGTARESRGRPASVRHLS